jgi:hypothetical protein
VNPADSPGLALARNRARDEVREVVLDALRERGDPDAYEDEGIDEWTEHEYRALASAALRVAADYFMQRDGAGYVVEELLRMGATDA